MAVGTVDVSNKVIMVACDVASSSAVVYDTSNVMTVLTVYISTSHAGSNGGFYFTVGG